MKKSGIALAAGAAFLAVAGSWFACSLFSDRYAVNAPMLNMMSGSFGADTPAQSLFGTRIRVPQGFTVGLFAEQIPSVRFLRPLAGGALLATTPREGKVWLLEPDRNGDGRSDGAHVLIEGLDKPHGLDLYGGALYVAEADGVGRVPIDASTGALGGRYERVVNGLPSGGNHWSRSVRFGPDGWMYVSVGSSCNVCEESDQRRAAMLRFRPDGSEPQIFASGLRNSVGYDWQPGTNDLYATDNGRDLLGDDFPPCELNRIRADGFYGWPFANGDRVPDPDLGKGKEDRIASSIPPAHGFGAHTAPLGITFLRNPNLPKEWRGAALVAQHGSWNRTRKSGYKVVSLHWGADGKITERDFLLGLEQDENVIGRPVDVAEGPDGTIYISDDYASVVYWVKPAPPSS